MSLRFTCVVACVRISFLLKGWIIICHIYRRFNRHELEQTPGVGEGQGSLMCSSPWGHKSWTRLSSWATISHDVSTTFCLSTHLFMVVWVASTFWLTNKAAVNMSVKLSLQISALNTFGCIPRSGIAGLDGSSMFSFLRSRHTVFCGDCSMLHFHQLCGRVSLSPSDCCHPNECEMVTN